MRDKTRGAIPVCLADRRGLMDSNPGLCKFVRLRISHRSCLNAHIAICLGFVFAAVSANAQVGGTGSIEGIVTDSSEAAITGAAVAATSVATV